MNRKFQIALGSLAVLCAVGLVFWWPVAYIPPVVSGSRAPGNRDVDVASSRPISQDYHVITGDAVTPFVSLPVRDLPPSMPENYLDRELRPRENPLWGQEDALFQQTNTIGLDPLVESRQSSLALGQSPDPLLSFEGLSTYSMPPDTIGDVGPNHYVQMVNVQFAIYDKQGTKLSGPTNYNALFTGQGGNCEDQNAGDPIVVYDTIADRWLLSQFADPNHLCVALSQSADPTGAYYLYEFNVGEFPDYFKFGTWPDGYYMSANESTYTAYVFNRTRMLAGQSASFQKFTGETNLLLPADLDGATLPPDGSPGYFYTFKDGGFGSHGSGVDRLEVFALDVDWQTLANSSFERVASIPIAAFNYTVCGFFEFACITQPDTGNTVDSISEWPMWRLQYRNFGTYETLVGNFTVDVDGSDWAGIRWFELRKQGSGTWTLYQEGTLAPDGDNRWLGSAAMDQAGNIAVGYSVSSESTYPSLRYATHRVTDPLGTMQQENVLIAGGGSQTGGGNRWGDYAALTVDPVDDCTFWYTNEYYATTSATRWLTRIGTFRLPNCPPSASVNVGIHKAVTPDYALPGTVLIYTLTFSNTGEVTATQVVVTDIIPSEVTVTDIASSLPITATGSLSYVWTLPDLGPGARGVITLTGVVSPELQSALELVNQADISSAGDDQNTIDNSSQVTTTIYGASLVTPTLLSPANGAVMGDNTPTLQWVAVPDAAGYRLSLGGVISDVGNVTQYTLPLLADDVYTWTVAAYNPVGGESSYAEPWTFTVDSTLPVVPVLLSPADTAVLSTANPLLVWEAVTDAVGYQLSLDGVLSDVGNVTQYELTDLDDGVYTWTVAAYNDLNLQGDAATVRTFTVDTKVPMPPALRSPTNTAQLEDNVISLVWYSSAGASGYHLKLDAQVINVGNTISFTTEPLSTGVHTWTLAAYDDAGNTSPYTNTWTFTVLVNVPSTPVLLSPLDGAVLNLKQPTLIWESVPDAAGYLVKLNDDVIDVGNTTLYVTPILTDGDYAWTAAAYRSATSATIASPYAVLRSFTINTLVYRAYLPVILDME